MRKFWKVAGIGALLAVLFWAGTCLADRRNLGENLIRLHVVGASDSQMDQEIKLNVRDAILERLHQENLQNVQQARTYIRTHLTDLKREADRVLQEAGMEETCSVTLGKACFPTRKYDTFTLPQGVYESLQVTIGIGAGKNWWCVVFPDLCLGATTEEFEDAAEAGGFPDSLSGALEGKPQYQIRFYFLELLGKLENLFHQ